jgi:hypothetical protein
MYVEIQPKHSENKSSQPKSCRCRFILRGNTFVNEAA